MASAATAPRRNGRVDTPANHGHTTGRASPERRNRAPACLHAPHDMTMDGVAGSCLLARRSCFRTDCRSCHTSLYEHMAEQTHQPITATQQAAHRRRGGISPLRVSTPHELKSCPSTSPTHPGLHDQRFLTCQREAVAFFCLDATWTGTNIEAEEVASTVTPERRNGGANAPAEHVHRRSHTSPERRNRAPACLHAP